MKKIAVINRTNLRNYGSVLQVYALCESIKKLGYQAEVVWERGTLSKNWDLRIDKIVKTLCNLLLHPRLFGSIYKTAMIVGGREIDADKVSKFEDFVCKHITRYYYSRKQLGRIANTDEYFKYVCGSDQIWSATTLYVDPLMYLRFAPIEKRIAYAPSLGRDYIPDYNKRIMRKYISDIPFVSVREDVGKQLILNLTGRDVPVVLDPTLLLTTEDWDMIKIVKKRNDYILCYFLDATSKDVIDAIEEICLKNKKSVINIGCPISCSDKVTIINESIGPGEFLDLVENADLVFTDSYHGMLFSIIYQKSFWSIARNYGEFDQSSRQKTVLSMLHLEDRYVDERNLKCFSFERIDYSEVNDILKKKRAFSINYLDSALRA